MGAVLVQPEDRLAAFGLLTFDGQVHPVLDRRLAGRGRAPDVALFHLVLVQHGAVVEDHLDGATFGDLEGRRMRSVFLGLLCHQADILNRACGRRVEFPVLFEELDRLVIDRRIGIVGDHAVGVVLLVVRTPALAAVADQRGHGGVDDHVGGHVQVGDALVGIHHVHRRAHLAHFLDRGHDLGLARHLVQQGTHAAIGIDAQLFHLVAVLVEDRLEPLLDRVTEDDRVRNLHHRGLHVQREQNALFLGLLDFLGQERVQRLGGHVGRVDHGALGVGHALFQDGLATCGFQDDLGGGGLVQRRGHLVGGEIARRHRRHAGLAVGGPFAHAVRVGLGVFLHRDGGPAVRVAFAQDRVHGGTLDRVVLGADGLFFFGFRLVGIIGQRVSLRLQFLHRRDQLRDGSGDVGQLDDVGFGRLHQFAQHGQVIGDALVFGQGLREGRDDATGQGDILGADRHARGGGEGLNDRKQRGRCELRRFVYLCIHNIGGFAVSHDFQAFVEPPHAYLTRAQTSTALSRLRRFISRNRLGPGVCLPENAPLIGAGCGTLLALSGPVDLPHRQNG